MFTLLVLILLVLLLVTIVRLPASQNAINIIVFLALVFLCAILLVPAGGLPVIHGWR